MIEPLVALSIRQPWASLIILGFKDIENRSWRTKRRGRFLVHASQAVTAREIRNARALIDQHAALRDNPEILAVLDPVRLRAQAGGIIGSVELVDCHDAHASPWFVGPHGFSLRAPQSLPLVPMPGRLNFFPVPNELLAQAA
jgi:peptidoglycan/xylan/chitin deacetylase (PgdA/CDA1 family)